MEKVLCKGILPGTDEKCDEVAYLTDGKDARWFIAPKSRLLRVDLNPLRLKCRKCGYEMKLVWKDRKH